MLASAYYLKFIFNYQVKKRTSFNANRVGKKPICNVTPNLVPHIRSQFQDLDQLIMLKMKEIKFTPSVIGLKIGGAVWDSSVIFSSTHDMKLYIWVGFYRMGVCNFLGHFFENFEGFLWPNLISQDKVSQQQLKKVSQLIRLEHSKSPKLFKK